MHILWDHELLSTLATLIDEADLELKLVSPSIRLRGGERLGPLEDAVKAAVTRGVDVTVIVREPHPSLELPGVTRVEVPDLHARVMMSEDAAILTSLELVSTAPLSTTDLAVVTHDPADLERVRTYLRRVVLPRARGYDDRAAPAPEERHKRALDQLTAELLSGHQRATIGAASAVVFGEEPGSAKRLGDLLRTRPHDHRHCWIVSRRDGLPPGFPAGAAHPELQKRPVLTTAEELRAYLRARG